MNSYDIVVIGGGIHGCAAAANAAGRGLNVLLVEKGDLASQTSSASSKLIHGGLRYLELGEFHLVALSLQSRRQLLQQAPHLVRPLGFVLPYTQGIRPKWQIQLGLKLYDFLARKDQLPASRHLDKHTELRYFSPLHPHLNQAFLYYDAKTDDARLTLENALSAKQFGAQIETRTCVTAGSSQNQHWQLTLTPEHGLSYPVKTKAIINTAGPWVNQIQTLLQLPSVPNMTLVKGSHLVLPALYPGNEAYILQHPDQRIIFCIPYHGYTLVGTTDLSYTGDPSNVQMDAEEARYLCELVQLYFRTPVRSQDILHHWSGVRTLVPEAYRKPSQLSRNHHLHKDNTLAPIVSLYGGKLTTHQHSAQQLVDTFISDFPSLKTTALAPFSFPGAQSQEGRSYLDEVQCLKHDYAWLPPQQFNRYLSQYGTRMRQLLDACGQLEDLGELIFDNLYTKEIDFLCEQEWAKTAEDILWRRTKLGLGRSELEVERLTTYLSLPRN